MDECRNEICTKMWQIIINAMMLHWHFCSRTNLFNLWWCKSAYKILLWFFIVILTNIFSQDIWPKRTSLNECQAIININISKNMFISNNIMDNKKFVIIRINCYNDYYTRKTTLGESFYRIYCTFQVLNKIIH